ncbi:dCTP deaminase [bacterium endosymbiont of Pedicinus badii]|uniref:dCTP deaminase n=1 Tax=bacterium endosymbiont of Pedicinus badii TaxID=1719126 RepID=UPI0009BB9658|nr:dCTP deaminase [bacterium endosymbiont of Pedicinus badii]OQM34436.1 deoxycytidine triphosphate deaminase [bacterium endosymbiont of Pedicinus badii]
MFLCDKEIEKWIENKKILIFPKVSKNRINGASLDLTLDNRFRIFSKSYKTGFIDCTVRNKKNYTHLKETMSKEIIIKNNKKFFLHPKNLVLATTTETLSLPENLLGFFNGRSSLARIGLIVHATAQFIDPGWNGKIVLELYNLGELPIALKKGIIIGSVFFSLLNENSVRPYNIKKNAKYKNQSSTLISKINKDTF